MDTSTLVANSRHSFRTLEKRLASRWRLATLFPVDSDASIQRSLLRLLAVAHRERLDVVTLVHHFADEHRGIWRFRLRRLARRLESGTPLVDALEQTPEVLSPAQILAIRFATQSGTLTTTFERLVKQPSSDHQIARIAIRRALVYGITLIVVISLVSFYLSVFILPTLKDIGEEFEIDLPWSMLKFMEASRFISSLGSVGFVLFWLGLMISGFAPVRRLFVRILSSLWTRVSTQQRSAELLRLLSTSIGAGRPLSGSLAILARYHFDPVVRNRLLFVRNEVELGAEAWECLERAKFLSGAEADAIRGASDARLQSWTLAQIATAKSAGVANRREKMAALARPIVVLSLAMIVFWIAAAFIQFLYQFIAAWA